MNLSLTREELLKPLQAVIGVVEKRQTLPILSNVHIAIKEHEQELAITASDLEVEVQARETLKQQTSDLTGSATKVITVPGRKLMDICRSLPEDSNIHLSLDQDKLIIRCGRSRFSLTTLPATDFPLLKESESATEFAIDQKSLRYLASRTHFAMAQQDVRYYLNGMLLEINDGNIKTVATDGHRLALNAVPSSIINNAFLQVILPRKGVSELLRLIDDNADEITVQISNNYARLIGKNFTFTSKLIDGRFPDYEKVLPRGGDKVVIVDREYFKQALSRASILSNEKFRGVRLQLKPGMLKIFANNPEQEEAEEEISIDYNGSELEIGFNVSYLLDVLNNLHSSQAKMTFGDSKSSLLIEEYEEGSDAGESSSLFVVMPMML